MRSPCEGQVPKKRTFSRIVRFSLLLVMSVLIAGRHSNDVTPAAAELARVVTWPAITLTSFCGGASIVRDNGGEEGLLSLAFPPDYATKGYFYVYYTDDRVANRGNNVVSRFHLGANANTANPASEEIILPIPHPPEDKHNARPASVR